MPTRTVLFILLSFTACASDSQKPPKASAPVTEDNTPGDKYFKKIEEIPLPEGYIRIEADSQSFGYWLRKLSLKKDKTVYKYDGTRKLNQSAQYAVIDISVGQRDLQQCADAVMRLRAEFLFDQKRYSEIVFWDNEGRRYAFAAPYTRTNLNSYLQRVFGMCGSASLAGQLKKKKNPKEINPGDVLIRGGFPGHAVIVTDVALDDEGSRIYQIAQSYMPAQNVHVLKNPRQYEISPWYYANNDEYIYTPEYTFKKGEWMEW